MIFIVEDDNAARDSLRFLLECEGLEVEDFPSAEAFLNAHPAKGDGCLIVDVNMPGMSGLELLEDMRRNGNDLAAIVVTGLPSTAAKTRAERAGAGFLEKPFSDEGILDLIRHSLGSA